MILLYLVVLILVAIVLFGVGSVLFGRGERLPPLPRATTATVLPASGVTGEDVDAVKFTQTLRGYKTSEVDWVLDRLGQELDLLRGELSAVHAAYGIAEDDGYEDRAEGAHALPDELSSVPAGSASSVDPATEDRPEGTHALSDDGPES
jgi:DivIVA domain-containing protein